MADEVLSSTLQKPEAALSEPFQADEMLKLQTKFRTFYKSAVKGSVDKGETDRWCHYIQNTRIWDCLKNIVPELMIREDQVSQIPGHPLTRLHLVLKNCGYLEPAVLKDPLGTVRQREFEAVQDYLYHIFPVSLHLELHGFVDAMYEVQTFFPCGSGQDDSTDLTTGLGEARGARGTPEDTYNPHAAAQCDRIFNTLCAMWLIYRQDAENPAYQKFRDAYKNYRTEQEGWDKM